MTDPVARGNPHGSHASCLSTAFAVAALLAAAAGPAAAQTADAGLRKIAGAADTVALEATAARLLAPLPPSGSPFHVLRGFSALRRHELTGAALWLDTARASFQRALNVEQTALGQYGAGLSLQRGPEVGGKLLATGRAWSRILGFDARARARRAFERALELDASLEGAAVALGELALQARDQGELMGARDALARTVASRTAGPAAAATLARVAAALGDSATAVSIANGMAVADAPPGALHALLWALSPERGREADVGEAFYRLVDGADAALLDRLYLELHPILDAKELAAWKEGDLEARRALLRGGWEARATLAGVSVAERIAEHWRRLGAAAARFPRRSMGRRRRKR